jgi:hypothetical protein
MHENVHQRKNPTPGAQHAAQRFGRVYSLQGRAWGFTFFLVPAWLSGQFPPSKGTALRLTLPNRRMMHNLL